MEIVLFIDTCNKKLAVGIAKNEELIYKKEYEAFKKQSEYAAIEIKEALDKTGIEATDLNKIVVTNGPGSYTGIRIGLTLAKVMASSLNIELVTLSTLLVIAGKRHNVLSMIDAKGNRAYVGFYNESKRLKEDTILTLNEIEQLKNEYELMGDTYLVNLEEKEIDIIQNMFDVYKNEEIVSADDAKAIYLKD